MKARVKKEYRWKSITAFGGVEFTKNEYRNVPVGCEEEASKHPAIEILIEEPEQEKQEKKLPTAEQLLKDIVEKEPIEVQEEPKKYSRHNKKE